jgi:hypothetical protein
MRFAIWTRLTFNFSIYGPAVAVKVYYESLRHGETWMATLDGKCGALDTVKIPT